MEVTAIDGAHRVVSDNDLKSVLMRRVRDGANNFWLAHDGREFPTLAILVKSEIACLYYMPQRGINFQSMGEIAGVEGTDTSFTISLDGEQIEVQNSAVVPFRLALAAAIEFFDDADRLPPSVGWSEL